MFKICVDKNNNNQYNGPVGNNKVFRMGNSAEKIPTIQKDAKIDLNISSKCTIDGVIYTIEYLDDYSLAETSITSLILPHTIKNVGCGFAENAQNIIFADLSLTKITCLNIFSFLLLRNQYNTVSLFLQEFSHESKNEQ